MSKVLPLLVVAGAAAAAWWYLDGSDSGDSDSAGGGTNSTGGDSVIDSSDYENLANYQTYKPDIDAAAAANGLPDGLLDNLLYQESGYNPNAVNAKSGATGIAQFMPATAASLGIDPTDPAESISGAAEYLAKLYAEFGNWPQAVGAYNWGPGNMAKWIKGGGVGTVPTETVNYVARITGSSLTA